VIQRLAHRRESITRAELRRRPMGLTSCRS
jgi:hypothetical protein